MRLERMLFIVCLPVLYLAGCNREKPAHVFTPKTVCARTYELALRDFREKAILAAANDASVAYVFYSPSLNTCIAKVATVSPAPHGSYIWFYDTLEHRVLYEVDDEDLNGHYRLIVEQADTKEKELRH